MMLLRLLGILAIFLFVNACVQVEQQDFKEEGFVNITSGPKLHAYWQWMDGAITKEGITRDLEAMHEQGITQAAILNVSLFDGREMGVDRKLFASEEWFGLFRWALEEAERLGITIGMHSSDGWSGAAGPWITPEHSMKRFTWTKTIIQSLGRIDTLISQPKEEHQFYRDVAVIAFKTNQRPSRFYKSDPVILRNRMEDASVIADGSPVSCITLIKGDTIDIDLDSEFTFDKVTVFPYHHSMWGEPENYEFHFSVYLSDDDIQYRHHTEIEVSGSNQLTRALIPEATARHVRLVLSDSRNRDYTVPATIGEIELLNGSEEPLFSPLLPDFIQKGASVRSKQEQYFSRIAGEFNKNRANFSDVVDISNFMDSTGRLAWDAPPGHWAILRVGYTATGNINNPASPEGVGLECDKLDTTALGLHFRNFPAKLIDVAGDHTGKAFRFILLDSWESDYQNWTSLMPMHFEKRNGYSMIPWLAVLCGEVLGSPGESEAFLYDFRSTIAHLLENNYYKYYRELCNKKGLEFHAEAIYGNYSYPPIDIISANRHLDMPMTEFWTSEDAHYNIRFDHLAEDILHLPVSASRLYGMPVTGAEAYTGLAHFSESLFDLKPFGDKAFTEGINQIILHGYVHQPDERRPGFTLGRYAAHFNRHNTWWPFMQNWVDYQSRIQFMLQQGNTVTDVLYYLGDQLPQFTYSNVSNQVPPGYTLTACNFDVIKNRIEISGGRIVINDTDTASIMSLPPYPFMHFKTLLLLEDLVKQGMVLFASKPLLNLTREDFINNRDQFNMLATKMWGEGTGQDTIIRNYGKGKIFWGISLKEAMLKARIRPDFSTVPDDRSSFRFIHKKVGDIDIYFVANQTDTTLCHNLVFRVTGKTPQIWDPETGDIMNPAIYADKDGETSIPITFSPFRSYIFVFTPQKQGRHIVSVHRNNNLIFPHPHLPFQTPVTHKAGEVFEFLREKGGHYVLTSSDNITVELKIDEPLKKNISEYYGNIEFDPAYDSKIESIPFKELKPLTSFDDPAIMYFSGSVHYTFKFPLPEEFHSRAGNMVLDIGEYHSVAKVTLNGNYLGNIWGNTSQLDVTGLLQPFNQLEVIVANEYRNRIIGDLTQFGELRNLWTPAHVKEFLGPDQPLKQSGWTGPVKLTEFEKVVFTFD